MSARDELAEAVAPVLASFNIEDFADIEGLIADAVLSHLAGKGGITEAQFAEVIASVQFDTEKGVTELTPAVSKVIAETVWPLLAQSSAVDAARIAELVAQNQAADESWRTAVFMRDAALARVAELEATLAEWMRTAEGHRTLAVQLEAQVARVRAEREKYENDTGGIDPEDGWRFLRDLDAALDGEGTETT